MRAINKWIEDQTKGRISNMLTSPPPVDTKLTIVNAVYFKGAWTNPFSEEFTRVEDFFVDNNDVVKVKFAAKNVFVKKIDIIYCCDRCR